jgi:molybdopterin converting factor small subunit
MPTVHFTNHLQNFLDCPAVEVPGDTVRTALETVFSQNPRMRSYVLDDQGRVRRHVNVFVDGTLIRDRVRLSDPLRESSEIFVMQALSGG